MVLPKCLLDPMSMEEIDMIIKLKPKKEWKSADTKEGLADKFKEALSVIPGIDYEFTQPIEMRFNELITVFAPTLRCSFRRRPGLSQRKSNRN